MIRRAAGFWRLKRRKPATFSSPRAALLDALTPARSARALVGEPLGIGPAPCFTPARADSAAHLAGGHPRGGAGSSALSGVPRPLGGWVCARRRRRASRRSGTSRFGASVGTLSHPPS